MRFIFLFLFLFPIIGQSQTPVNRAFRMSTGFGSNSGYSVITDSRGFIWASPDANGVVMFNGKEFTHFSDKDGLCGNQIMTIYEDQEGQMWFGSQGYGISTYNGQAFTNYTTKDSVGLTTDNVSSLLQHSNGTMIIGGFRGGMMLYDKGKFFSISDSTHSKMTVWHILEDSDGVIWFTTTDFGLGKLELGATPEEAKFTFYAEEVGLPKRISLGFIQDKINGDLIIGNAEGIFRFNDGKVVKEYDETNGFYKKRSKRFIRSLYQRDNGDIYFGCFGRLWMLTGDTCFRVRRNGQIGSAPTNFTEDPNGNLWMTTEGNGLVQLLNNGINVVSNRQGGNDFFMSQAIENDIYACSANALYKIVDNTPVRFGDEFKANLHSFNQLVVRDEHNILMFSYDHGVILSKYDEESDNWNIKQVSRVQQFQHDRLNDSIVVMTQPNSITLFNIYTYELEQIFESNVGTQDYGLPYSIALDQNKDIWIGRFDNGSIIRLNDQDTLLLDSDDGMPEGAIKDLLVDENNVVWYLSMNGEFGYYKNGKVTNFAIPFLGSTGSMEFDDDGNLWVGHSKGIVFIEVSDYQVKYYHLFNKSDGVEEVSTMYGGVSKTNDGRIVIMKESENMYVVEPSQVRLTQEKPLVFLKRVMGKDNASVQDDWFEKRSGFFGTPQKLRLPYSDNHITFHLDNAFYSQPDSIKYSYKLPGYTDEWSEPQSSSVITITNLPPGDYLFECKAIGPHGIESDIIKYEFSVETPWYKTILFYVSCVLCLLILVFLIIKWRLNKLQKDKQRLEHVVEERTKEVVLQKEHLAEKNQEIMDSINYAKRIQTAILPPAKIVKEYLKNSFILYKPKDIVAGDFYWMEQKGEAVLFAAADCTGHGVPGAMVSVVCNNGLNRAVREFGLTEPGPILDKTREIVISEFEKSEEEVKDGMDIALCSLQGNTLKYAGAHNPLWIVRKGASEVEEIKADKQPIGKYDLILPYKTHTIQLEKGDQFYLFSDGYADQFGGESGRPGGKKFKTASFKRLLISIKDESMEKQFDLIDLAFEEWRGDIEQLDDVCVIGVRV